MKPGTTAARTGAEAEKQVQGFIAKFEPKHQRLIRAVRKALRRRFPTAYELAYDNYNFFVLGYGPTERPSDCIVSMAAGANGVGLCLIRGASLPDRTTSCSAPVTRPGSFASNRRLCWPGPGS